MWRNMVYRGHLVAEQQGDALLLVETPATNYKPKRHPFENLYLPHSGSKTVKPNDQKNTQKQPDSETVTRGYQ